MLRISDCSPENLQSGKLANQLPEFYALKNIIENNAGHINDPVFNHCIRTAQKISELLNTVRPKTKSQLANKIGNYSRAELVYIAALLHDIGKQAITPTAEGAFIGHEKAGAELVKNQTLQKIDITPAEQAHIADIITHHGLLHEASNNADSATKNVQSVLIQHPSIALELILLFLADLIASDLPTINPSAYNFKTSLFANILQNEQY